LLFVAALLSLVSLAAPWISILTAGRIRLAITAKVSLISLIATFAAMVVASTEGVDCGWLWWHFQRFFGP
jgi:hypothetical protein